MRSSSLHRSASFPEERLDLRGVLVLVVEDNDDGRDMLRQMIEAFGATVLTARDGREAMRFVADAKPDLVLLDLLMPRMNGFDFLDYLRERKALARLPVIAVTALGAPADVMRTWEAGFNGHLVKPITMDILEAQLERVFWAHRQEQAP